MSDIGLWVFFTFFLGRRREGIGSLFDKSTLLDQRYSSTVSDDSFSRENLSIWTGNNK
jgi:hypothetical protein